jgi:hypothetical protein
MHDAAEAFLDEVWPFYLNLLEKDKTRIFSSPSPSTLYTGSHNYLKFSWQKGKFQWADGTLAIDLYEPLSWSDSSHKLKPELDYMSHMTDEILAEEVFPELQKRVNALLQEAPPVECYFSHKLELVLEVEWKQGAFKQSVMLRNETKREYVREKLQTFIGQKVMTESPARPKPEDEFFLADALLNPELIEQSEAFTGEIIDRVTSKLQGKKRIEEWRSTCTTALKRWAEESFLPQYFNSAGHYGLEWELKPEAERRNAEAKEMDFFIYAAKKIGEVQHEIPAAYFKLAVELGSERAEHYLLKGSGLFEHELSSGLIQAKANDILMVIELRMLSEEEEAYRQGLQYICSLLSEGFPRSYNLKLKNKDKTLLPIKGLAKSQLHRFFAACLHYPALHPVLAQYAELAMQPFAWYGDVEAGEKSVMPGTYAVLGLGLYSTDYFPLVQRYMEQVDEEHQMAHHYYLEAFLEAHGAEPEWMPVIVSILRSVTDSAKPSKLNWVNTPELAAALHGELESLESYEREKILYLLFGSSGKLKKTIKVAEAPLKQALEALLEFC